MRKIVEFLPGAMFLCDDGTLWRLDFEWEDPQTCKVAKYTWFKFPDIPQDELPPKTDISINEVDFSVRTINVLNQIGIKTLGHLTQRSKLELLRAKNMGRRSVNEIEQTLLEYGLYLRID